MTPDIAIGAIVTICLYTDLRYRKIFNLVLLPAFLLALVFNLSTGGIGGLLFSLTGALLGLSLLLIPFMLGGMGAGDVKLLAVIGAWQGPQFVWFCFLCTAIVGGIIATFQLVRTGKLRPTFKFILFTLVPGSPKVNAFGTLATAKVGEAFPYGVAIAAGTLATYVLR
ncbi:peptidase A24A prepilin type IV [Desulfotomaculum nigrificans CO-1-SRB]|uniref:Peptidase A24A prepilin type IV n=1 Tax=Desulfotomaculum nigrificans (strain DSM 14880 / VKM B-2319 / CO-1-SRB) TaxID=868595 RepID=F6B3M3_DESCC|nr:prepilin peptidase [Desulfotomaculum nigrificans]AEF94052.1 peptidase A24A prepilin type IV [Desulfotomaculum nigrificans CO-1-SRB]